VNLENIVIFVEAKKDAQKISPNLALNCFTCKKENETIKTVRAAFYEKKTYLCSGKQQPRLF
jgi:hypothetical protein